MCEPQQLSTEAQYNAQRNPTKAYEPSLRERVLQRAQANTAEAGRLERLAQTLTPEVEKMIWCLREGILLGVIELPLAADRSGLRRY